MSGKAALGRKWTLTQLAVLLIAVAVAIAIAVPVHRTRALRTRREEATQALREIQAAEENYLLRYNRYAARLSSKPPLGLGLSEESSQGHYALRLDVDDPARPSRFTAHALANAAASRGGDPNCRSFSLDQNGIRKAEDTDGADRTALCWR